MVISCIHMQLHMYECSASSTETVLCLYRGYYRLVFTI